VVPARVHVRAGGRFVRSGGRELALALARRGYDWVQDGTAAA
jgi:Fe-S cluster assembly ATPase SufC